MTSPERIKEIFLALKLHFSSNYNFIRYDGKLRPQTIKGKEGFVLNKLNSKLTTEEMIINFFVYNMTESWWKNGNIATYYGTYINKDYIAAYEKWQAWLDSSEHNFKQDLLQFEGKKLKDIVTLDEGHPEIFKKMSSGRMHPNSVAILILCAPQIVKYWEKKAEDPVMEQFVKTIKSYSVFLKINQERHKKILENQFKNVV